MKAFPFKSNLLVLTLTLLFVLGPGSGKAQGDVKIRGEKLPSDVLHVVDTQFQDPNNGGVQQIQFRDLSLSLDEATELFLYGSSHIFLTTPHRLPKLPLLQ